MDVLCSQPEQRPFRGSGIFDSEMNNINLDHSATMGRPVLSLSGFLSNETGILYRERESGLSS